MWRAPRAPRQTLGVSSRLRFCTYCSTGLSSFIYLLADYGHYIKGESGIALAEVWKDLPVTYRSVAIPHMPNFFLLNGPYSPGGTASIVGIVEVQAAYLMQVIERIATRNVTLAPRAEACARWLESARERARGTVWNNGGCKSWYLDKSGTPAFDPITLSALEAAMTTPDFADFVERPAET